MHKFNAKLMAAVSLAAVLAVACGGDDHVAVVTPPPNPAAEAGQSVQKTVDYLNSLVAGTSDSSDPDNIDAVTLAVDDTAEPTAL
jgi:hypothetical protein